MVDLVQDIINLAPFLIILIATSAQEPLELLPLLDENFVETEVRFVFKLFLIAFLFQRCGALLIESLNFLLSTIIALMSFWKAHFNHSWFSTANMFHIGFFIGRETWIFWLLRDLYITYRRPGPGPSFIFFFGRLDALKDSARTWIPVRSFLSRQFTLFWVYI